jgi:MSHA biogenesis protein MshQ
MPGRVMRQARSGLSAMSRGIAGAVLAFALMLTGSSHAACSPHVGKVVFNELYQPNSGTSFIEIKVLDPSVVAATNNFQNWKVDLYSGSFGNKQATDVSSGFSNSSTNSCGQTSLWIRFPESVFSFLNSNAPPYNFVLYDSSGGGKIVDIFRVGNSSGNITSYYGAGSQYTSCPLIENALPATGTADSQYDALMNSGASVKDWYRNPDGTGPWGGNGTSNPGNTSCGTNNGTGTGTYGLLKIPASTVVPVNTDFSYTLYSVNGATAVSSPASVVVTDDLNAAGLTFVSCTTARGSCLNSGGVVTWTVGAVGANTSYTATLTVRAAAAGSKTNTITSNVGSGPSVFANSVPVTVFNQPLNYGLDGNTWTNGTTVPDIGGNGISGTVVLSSGSASSTAGVVCTGVSMGLGVGEGIRVPSNTAFDISGGGTISFWIKPTDNTNRYVFSKSDEFFAYLNASGKVVFGSGNNGLLAYLKGWVTSTTTVPTGSWTHVALVFDRTASKAYIYLNGQQDAVASSIAAPTFGSANLLLGSLDAATWLVYELLSGRNGFQGAMDEFKIFKAALTAGNIWSLYGNELAGRNYDGSTRSCNVGPSHVELSHDGAALTCTPKAITVYGCTSGSECTTNSAGRYAGSFPLSLTAIAGASWCLDSICATPLVSPATVSSGQVIYLKDVNVRTDTMAGSASSATNTAVQCYNSSSGAFNASAACQVAFAASGFLVSLPHHASCASSTTLSIQAVKASDNAASCVPAFTGTRSATISFNYSNPASGTVVPTVGGTAISTGGTLVNNLSFDGTGTATPSFVYADVGKLSITVSDSTLGMTGSTTTLPVVAPASFGFSAVTAGPIAAGGAFSGTVTALNACATPAATPNFGKETAAESVGFSLGSRVQPAGTNDCVNGPCDGAVSGSVALPWSGGSATASNLTYSEVGTMTMKATLASGSYLGSGLSASGTSATLGAFVPAYFDTVVTPGCGSFTYSRQPFTVAVTARNVAGGTTVNYSDLAGCVLCSKSVSLQDPTATANFNGTNTIGATSFVKGIGTSNGVTYTWPAATTAPATITLRAVDSSVTPNVTSNVSVLTYPTHVEGTTVIRSGRLHLFNAYGSELLPLRVAARAEYYTGTGWSANTTDTCTSLPASAIAVGNRVPAGLGSGVSSVQALGGASWNIVLAVPSAPGIADLAVNLGSGTTAATNVCLGSWSNGPNATTAPSPSLIHLAGQWCSSPANSAPVARVRFGTPKAPYIYLRERY